MLRSCSDLIMNGAQQEHRPLPEFAKHHRLFALKQSRIGFGEANDGVATLFDRLLNEASPANFSNRMSDEVLR